jgi:hypothetical protein
LVVPNATTPLQPNSSAWLSIKLYFNSEEALLDADKTYALVLSAELPSQRLLALCGRAIVGCAHGGFRRF